MKRSVRSYLAEPTLLDPKQTRDAWIYRESCALFDRATLTSLIHREDHGGTPCSLTEFAALPMEEQDFLHHVLNSNDHVVLHGEQGVLILLRHLELATGLLLALRASVTGGERQHLIRTARQMGFAISPACQRLCRGGSPHGQEQHDAVGESLHKLCNLLTPPPVQYLPGRILHLASFAGIALDVSQLPLLPSRLSPLQQSRLMAFLLCLFLTLRRQNGRLNLRDLPKEHPDSYAETKDRPLHFRMEWSRIPSTHRASSRTDTQASPLPPVLNRPCFGEFRIVDGPGGLAVELTLHPRRSLIRATGAPRSLLLLRLIPAELTTEPSTANSSGVTV